MVEKVWRPEGWEFPGAVAFPQGLCLKVGIMGACEGAGGRAPPLGDSQNPPLFLWGRGLKIV